MPKRQQRIQFKILQEEKFKEQQEQLIIQLVNSSGRYSQKPLDHAKYSTKGAI